MNLFNLIGKLTLDTSDYDKGIENAKKENEEFAGNTSKTTVAAAAKWAAVVAIIMKVAQVIKGLVTDSTQYADKIKNMAQIYGYTTREIQEMMSVANQSGKDIERVLRGIKSSGQTAAEYLGLTAEEYKGMVNEAYEFGTILSDSALNKVDALGDRVAYLKAEWTAAVTAMLSGEEGSEQAVDMFFDNLSKTVDQYAPVILRFVVKLTLKITKGLIEVVPDMVGDVIAEVINTILSINWFEVGWKIAVGIVKGVWNGFKKFFGKIFNSSADNSTDNNGGGSSFVSNANIGSNDYEVTENVTQKIDVNLKFDGDTPIGRENAELVGGAVAQQIDEILGRRLNG